MNQAERNKRMLSHIRSAQKTIQRCSYADRYPCIVGSLRSMLEGMAGLGDYDDGEMPPLYPSVFDPSVTEAIRALLATIESSQGTPGLSLSPGEQG
jgi:hypothetical protein